MFVGARPEIPIAMIIERSTLFDHVPEEFQVRCRHGRVSDKNEMLVGRSSDCFRHLGGCSITKSWHATVAYAVFQFLIRLIDKFDSSRPGKRQLLERIDDVGIEARIE